MHIVARTSLLAVLAVALASCSVLPPPSVSAVDSVTVASTDAATLSADAPTVLTIRGSDFGDRQGLNRLFYAGIEVPSEAIASWSDGSIELAYHHPAELIGGAAVRLVATSVETVGVRSSTYVAPEEQRFEVRTPGGSSGSEPVRLVLVDVWVGGASGAGETPSVTVRAYDLFGVPWPDLELSLRANRGTLTDETVVTNAEGAASTVLTTVSALPHAVIASVEGRPVSQDATLEYTVDPSWASVPPDEASTLDVTLTDRAATPALAANLDLTWTLVADSGPSDGVYDLGAHGTNASGATSLPIPALPVGLRHRLYAVQNGYVVATSIVDPGVAPLD